MAQTLDVQVQGDHIESLTNVSGSSALMELIWNSLDADATEITINTIENSLGIESIEIQDNGHGMLYDTALKAFENLGGSSKKIKKISPSKRVYHGEEGKGRYRVFGLGDLVKFKSYYNNRSESKFFEVEIERSSLKRPQVGDLLTRKADTLSGVKVIIYNINQKKANKAFSDSGIKIIEEKLALYYQQYPNFKISVNEKELDFSSYIKNEYEEEIPLTVDVEGSKSTHQFKIRIVEWARTCEKKIFYCNEAAIAFAETQLGVHTSGINLSAYLISDYIGTLHRQNSLNVAEIDVVLTGALDASKKIIKKYVRERIHERGSEFLSDLKNKEIYPYKEEPQNEVEKATRQVFDIVALNINEYVPDFSSQQDVSKKLTLTLVKEALENDSSAFQHVITEVLNLPDEKMEDLKDLLETTSLSQVIDTMKEVTDRLRFLYELKIIVMDTLKNKKVLERRHLHKIIEQETWIFSDEYALGASDVNLKNVLKAHLKTLGRDDFESIVDNGNNDSLDEIPDVCLWKQHNNGKHGYFRNLVVELKRPTVKAGSTELSQIKSYASKVSNDSRFEKDKTEWTFILLVNDIKDEILIDCEQENRKFGHVIAKDNLNVFIVKWGHLFNEAEARHQYLKEKLNYNISSDKEGLELLNKRYKEYLPESLIDVKEQ